MTANTTASVRAFADRRWLCLISAMVICVCAGFGYAWSVLQTPIIARFGWADSGVALAYTITVVCSTMAPLLFGGLIRRMSSRLCVAVGAVLFGAGLFAAGLMSQLWQLYLFYGVISGLGVGFIYPSMMAYVVRLFPDRSGMASGLGTAAYGSGAILWAPTAAALMEKVGLGSAFRVLGVLFAAVILLGSLLLAEPPEGFHAEPGTDGAHRGLLPDGGGIYLRPGGRGDRHQPGIPHPPADPGLRPRPGRPLRQRVLRLQHGRPLRVGQPLRPAGPG